MAQYDRVLIDPTPPELHDALRDAARAANHGRKHRLVPWPPPGLDRLDLGPAEGYRQWNGGDGPPRPGEGRSAVAVAWWTDRACRKHHRVVGQHGPFNRPMLDNMLCPVDEPRPPLWFVYPGHVFLKRQGGQRVTQAYCACGAFGTPDELGWMGPSCNACYDWALDGQPPAPAWLDPEHATLRGQPGRVAFLAGSPDGSLLAVGTGHEEIRLWDTATGQERGVIRVPDREFLLCIGWTADGKHIVTASACGHVRLWSARTALPAGVAEGRHAAEAAAVSPDGERVARGERSRLCLVTVGTDDAPGEWPLPGRPGCLAFSPDGRLIAAGTLDGHLLVWDRGGRPRARLEWPGALVAGLAFAPGGGLVAAALHPAPGSTGPNGHHIILIETHTGRPVQTLAGHAGGARCVAFAPDGRVLASGGEDGLVRLWDAASGRERVALEWHLDAVGSVAFTADGQTLASGSFDGTVKLWPREVLRPARPLRPVTR